jgi:HAD superfamily hydrolase (TIGR01509 family)
MRVDRADLTSIKAVLLDMDGTLVDSDAAVERAWTTWSGEFGADLTTVMAISHGAPAESTVRAMLPGLDEASVEQASARQLTLQYDDLADVVATPGAHDLLAAIEELSLPWAVVTSADRRLAALRLQAAGITPPVLVTVDDISAGKPDPEGYCHAAGRLGVDPADCLVVEDAAVGVTAGRAAGAVVAGLRGVAADLQIADLGQLAGWLRASRA